MLIQLQADKHSDVGYRSWDHNAVHYITGLSTFGVTYLSPEMKQHVPVGASSVLELYADSKGQTLNGWAILARGADLPGAAGWLSLEILLLDGSHADPAVNAMGDQACAVCHAPQPDYIVPPAQ